MNPGDVCPPASPGQSRCPHLEDGMNRCFLKVPEKGRDPEGVKIGPVMVAF